MNNQIGEFPQIWLMQFLRPGTSFINVIHRSNCFIPLKKNILAVETKACCHLLGSLASQGNTYRGETLLS